MCVPRYPGLCAKNKSLQIVHLTNTTVNTVINPTPTHCDPAILSKCTHGRYQIVPAPPQCLPRFPPCCSYQYNRHTIPVCRTPSHTSRPRCRSNGREGSAWCGFQRRRRSPSFVSGCVCVRRKGPQLLDAGGPQTRRCSTPPH
jgi:hypothetical protein